MIREIIDLVHEPEYTGENRCGACTVVNTAIAGILSALIARKSKLGAAITISLSAIFIYLRGYLIPGTPTLTKRYLPPLVLRLFGKESKPTIYNGFGIADSQQRKKAINEQTLEPTHNNTASTSSAIADNNGRSTDQPAEEVVDSVTPEKFFHNNDIIEPCANVDDFCLTEPFESQWYDEINQIDSGTLKAEDAAAAVGLTDDKENFEIDHHGDARVLQRNNRHIGQWPSQAALVADVTSAYVLDSWTDEWALFSVAQKGALLNVLRLFLETCPTTGGEVTVGEETVESCCRSHDVIAVTCEETGERLFEHPVSELEK